MFTCRAKMFRASLHSARLCLASPALDTQLANWVELHQSRARSSRGIMSALDSFEDFIRVKIERDHATHHQICEELTSTFPGKRGFSVRSIRRFCQEKNIHKTSRMPASEVKSAVQEAVLKVLKRPLLYVCL